MSAFGSYVMKALIQPTETEYFTPFRWPETCNDGFALDTVEFTVSRANPSLQVSGQRNGVKYSVSVG
jgi:hypothetical protein